MKSELCYDVVCLKSELCDDVVCVNGELCNDVVCVKSELCDDIVGVKGELCDDVVHVIIRMSCQFNRYTRSDSIGETCDDNMDDDTITQPQRRVVCFIKFYEK